MKERIFILFLILLSANLLSAQTRSCNSHEYLQQQLQQDPERAAKMDAIEKQTTLFINSQSLNAEINGVITIPVVVHVVYANSTQNISAAQIQTQMDVLTEDFRRLNSDADNTWPQAADSEIEFCLATVDPNGNATNGITQTSSSAGPFTDDDKVKFTAQGGHDVWDAANYLNIWVCDIDGFLGYAQFPGGPAATDGVVCDYQYFGTNGTATAPFNLGRTATHEVGHYLNLYHIWGDGGCGQDDLVADTPLSDAANYGCATGHTSCGTIDMVQNYMDYSDDACMNLYTTGQKSRMRALFDTGGSRVSLLNSTACGGGGNTCDTPTGLNSSNVNNNTATISWNAATGAQNYDLQYRTQGTSSWTTQSNINGTSHNLSSLNNCTTYEARVRTNCASQNSTYSSSISFTTTGCASPCNTPAGLNSNNVNNNTATISWNATTGAQNYDLQYRTQGASSWTTQSNINATSYNLSGLDNCTIYEARVRTNCASQNSTYSSSISFTTTGCASPCNTPTGLNSSNVNNNTATVSWNAATGAQNYDLQYRTQGTSTWTTQSNINGTSYNLSGLNSCTTYEARVRTICTSQNSSYSASISFTTTGCTTSCQYNEVTLTIIPDDYGSEITWEVIDGNSVLYSGGPYTDFDNTPIIIDLCLEDGCFDFIINDSYGDGICCAWGNGSYTLTESNGNTLATGGDYGNGETVNFCVGNGGNPTGDAGITKIIRPASSNCGGVVSPRVKIKNFDSNPLTSVIINYNVDGGTNQTFQWTGSLASNTTKNINLPNITTGSGSHIFTAFTSAPNGGTDTNPNNNSKSKNFETTDGELVKIQIKPDDYGSEITWILENDNGNIVAEGGPYSNGNNTLKTTSVCLENGCYTFTIFDDYGDGICCTWGNGWYRIRDANNQNIIYGNGQYGNYESQSFCIGGNLREETIETDVQLIPELKVFPNPTHGKISVEVKNAKTDSDIKIYNTLGKLIKTIPVDEGRNTQHMDLSNFPSGLYFVKLGNGKKAISQKLMLLEQR